MSANEAFQLIINSSQIKGIDSDWRITDRDALQRSLTSAGLDKRQITAILSEDFLLDTYLELSEAEASCIKSFGLEVSPVTVNQEPTGLSKPGYGFALGSSGYSEEQANHIQAQCQNKFTGAYQLAYRARVGPSKEEEEEAALTRANAYLECVRSSGKKTPFVIVNADSLDDFMTWFAKDNTAGCSLFPQS